MTGLSLDELAAVAKTRPSVICDYCREPIVHDGDTWVHVRTGLDAHWRTRECRPLCKTCGGPATKAIGGECYDGWNGGSIRFKIDHFICDTCPQGWQGIVERVR